MAAVGSHETAAGSQRNGMTRPGPREGTGAAGGKLALLPIALGVVVLLLRPVLGPLALAIIAVTVSALVLWLVLHRLAMRLWAQIPGRAKRDLLFASAYSVAYVAIVLFVGFVGGSQGILLVAGLSLGAALLVGLVHVLLVL